MNSALTLQIAIVLGALAWKGQRIHASREYIPASGAPYTIVASLAALTLTILLDLPTGSPDGPHGLGPHVVQLGQNAALIATFVALQLLYLGYQREEGCRYSGRCEIAVAAGVVLVLTGLTGWAVATGNSLYYSATALRRPVVALFFFLPTLYILYASASQVVRGLRYAAQSTSRTRSAALVLTSFGMAMLFAATTLRGYITLSTVIGAGFAVALRETASVLITIGNPSVAAGLVLPLVAGRTNAALKRLRAGRSFRDLEPLWTLLTWTFPELVRPAQPAPPDAVGSAPDSQPADANPDKPTIGFLATSRRAECRDGYTKLRPYLVGEDVPNNDRVARTVREIATTAGGPRPGGASGELPPYAHGAELTDKQLVAISRALKSTDLSWCGNNTEERV